MNNAIFTAIDDNHWNYFVYMYNSLQKNYPSHPVVIVHYEGRCAERVKWLRKRKGIKPYFNTELSVNLISMHFHEAVPSKMVYYKYLLWTDKYDEYDNILHLDVDTIILGSLDDLFAKKDFFIVPNNIAFKEVRILPGDKIYKKDINKKLVSHNIRYPKHNDMVNAGIFLIPKKFRKREYLDSLVSITNDFTDLLVYADQSALSLWCLKHKIPTTEEYQYNFQTPLFNKFYTSRYKGELNVGGPFSLKKDILGKIKIIHFSSPIKPNCPSFLKWNLMGRYKKLFADCFKQYEWIPK